MNKAVEATGKTIDEAVHQALLQLGVDRDMTTVEVLDKPKTGFLGIGGTMARVRVSFCSLSPEDKARDFIEGLIKCMKADALIEIEKDEEDCLRIKLVGDNLGLLIGHRGETLDAIQHITGFVVNKGEEKRQRIIVDTENYRAKREEALERLARKMASKAVKYRRNVTLEPMNAYERHVIHAALQSWRDVSTFSTGSEPNRKIVISYAPGRKDGQTPPAGERQPRFVSEAERQHS